MLKKREYEIVNYINGGTFGQVYKAKDVYDNKLWAWKRLIKNSKNISREYLILDILKGKKYVVELLDFFYSKNFKNQLIQNFIFPFYPDSLETIYKKIFKNELTLKIKDIKILFKKILIGINEVHSLDICHRDLKPDNILIDYNLNPYITDFGASKKILGFNTPYVVSTYYRAPELIFGITSYNKEIDIWSFGVMLYEIIVKKIPFKSNREGTQLVEIYKNLGSPNDKIWNSIQNEISVYDNILDFLKEYERNESFFNELSSNLKNKDAKELTDLLLKCWNFDWKNRITSKQLLKHNFFKI